MSGEYRKFVPPVLEETAEIPVLPQDVETVVLDVGEESQLEPTQELDTNSNVPPLPENNLRLLTPEQLNFLRGVELAPSTPAQLEASAKIKARARARQDAIALQEVNTQIERIKTVDQLKQVHQALWGETRWPETPNNAMKQGKNGDCYVISALDAIKRNPDAFSAILQNISKGKENEWNVKIFDAASDGFEIITVDEDEVKKDTQNSMFEGALGDKILERALQSYTSRRRRRREGDHAPEGKTMFVDKVSKADDGSMKMEKKWEGGISHKALFELLGKPYQKMWKSGQSEMVQALHEIEADKQIDANTPRPATDQKIIATVYTKEGFEKAVRKDASWKIWQKENTTPFDVYPRHAYSLESVDTKNGIVTVRNPHDTSKPIQFPFKTFFQYFEGISYVKRMDNEKDVSNKTIVVSSLQQ